MSQKQTELRYLVLRHGNPIALFKTFETAVQAARLVWGGTVVELRVREDYLDISSFYS